MSVYVSAVCCKCMERSLETHTDILSSCRLKGAFGACCFDVYFQIKVPLNSYYGWDYMPIFWSILSCSDKWLLMHVEVAPCGGLQCGVM